MGAFDDLIPAAGASATTDPFADLIPAQPPAPPAPHVTAGGRGAPPPGDPFADLIPVSPAAGTAAPVSVPPASPIGDSTEPALAPAPPGPVSQETLPPFLAALTGAPRALPRDAPLPPPQTFLEALTQPRQPVVHAARPPAEVLAAATRGEAPTEAELQAALAALERGDLADPSARFLLAPYLSPEGRELLDRAMLTARLRADRKAAPKTALFGTDTSHAAAEGLFRGLTLGYGDVLQRRGPQDPLIGAIAEHYGEDPARLRAALERAEGLEREERAGKHPLGSLVGEAAGSVPSFIGGVQLLRAARAARGLPAVERSAAGYVKEGAKVGGAQAGAFRPEGAEDMSLGEELAARAVQAGIGVAAGVVLDVGAMKLAEWVGRYARLVKDKRFKAQLAKEARAAGFEDADTYIRALTEIEQTPDGPVIRPRADVLERLPGAEAPPAEPPATPPHGGAERREPYVDFGQDAPRSEALTDAGPGTPARTPGPADQPEAGAPTAPPGAEGARAKVAEYERLAAAATDPEIRAELARRAEVLRAEAAGRAPKPTRRERLARARELNPTQDDLLTAIRKLGGIDTEIETDWAGRLSHLPRRGFGLPAIERPGRGRSLDDLAEALMEHGYLERRDVGELYNKLDRAAAGDELYSFHADPARTAGRPTPRSTDRDWVWTDAEEAVTSDGDVVIADNGALVPARRMSYEDWLALEREMNDADRWFEREAADAGGAGGDRVPERLGDPPRGRVDQPPAGETGELPGIEPRDPAHQALADRQREIEARLRGEGEPIPPGMGEGDLFSGRARQTDLEDVPGAKPPDDFKLREPSGDEARRGGSRVPGEDEELEIYFPPRAPETQHLAALEAFGPRIRHAQTGTFPSGLTQARTPAQIAHTVAPLRREAQESFLAVVTDDAGNILRIARIAKGSRKEISLDASIIAGAVANTPGGRRAWFVHNHPSRVASQSRADEILTDRLHNILRGSGIEPQGSVVVTPGGRFTHYLPQTPAPAGAQGDEALRVETGDTSGQVEQPIPSGRRTARLPVTERRFVAQRREIPAIEDATTAAAALRDRPEGILLLDNRHHPVGFLPMSRADMRLLRQGASGPGRRLFAAIDETNASALIAKIDAPLDSSEFGPAAGNLAGFAQQTGIRLLDALDSALKSGELNMAVPAQGTFYANPFVAAAGALARDVGLHPGRSLAAGFAGGTVEATRSEHEPGSAAWWLDVARGAGAGATLAWAARYTRLIGKGSIADNAAARLGRWIESLPLIGRGPEALRALKAKQRLMQDYLDRQTAAVGKHLLEQFTPAERALMADLIERRGIVKDLNLIHRQAQALDDYLVHAARKMKELGMLPADLEEGGYLHRYYAKHVGLDKLFREAKQQSLAGSWSIARGTDDVFGREYFSPGARQVVDEFERVHKEIARFEKIGADLLGADNAKRLAELRGRKRALGKRELREFLGHQNGRLRSFLFATDEVGRVPFETPTPAGLPFTKPGVRGLADQPTPPPKAIDPRAMPVAPGIDDLKPTNYVWTVRGTKPNEALLHRDWTKHERQSWGEIEDAGYRYVRGMTEVAHDLSLATLFQTVARNSEWAADAPRATKGKAWVFVPDTRVDKNSPLRKYGALAGKYVRPDIWAGLKGYGRNPLRGGPRIPGTSTRIGDLYLDALTKWKLFKTVYNPVTHMNNSYSNVEMLYLGGYSPTEIATGIKHMSQGEGSAVWREARDQGLFGSDWTSSLLSTGEQGSRALAELAERLRTQPEIPDAAFVTSLVMDVKRWWIDSRNALAQADGAWKTGTALARAMAQPVMRGVGFTMKPVKAAARAMERAYRFEDNLFKMAVYAAERRRGAAPEAAVNAAQRLFFDYRDVPEGLKLVRDLPIGSPFISYPYFAAQAIARNAVHHPERLLLLVAGYEAWNYAALAATSDGMGPGEYWATESAAEETAPPWDRGSALWGARNTVHLPSPEGYRLALGRAHALGNPFMVEAGGREKLPAPPWIANFWGSSLAGGNPLHTLLDVAINEDWKGKPIYDPGAPIEEKVRKSLAYVYQAWTPSNPAFPGSYPQTRILEGLANDVAKARREGKDPGVIGSVVNAANDTAAALGFTQFTGLDRTENEILTRDALLGSFGVKLRPIRTELSVDIGAGKVEREKKAAAEWFQKRLREHAEGRLTDAQLEAHERAFDAALDRLNTAQDRLFDAEKFLEKRVKQAPAR